MRRHPGWLSLCALVAVAACFSQSDEVRVRVVPAAAAVPAGASFTFASEVDGTFSDDVTWQVVPGSCGVADCGTMAGAVYTAPDVIPPAAVAIEARSRVSDEAGTAEVQVVPFTVEPASGPTLGGTIVTIRAAGFLSGAQVFFDGVPATEVTLISPGEIRAVTPPRASPGPVEVRVDRGNGEGLVWPGVFRYAATYLKAGGSQLRRTCFSNAPPVLADLSGDGVADVLSACASLAQIAVHAGDGEGGFGPLAYVPTGLLSTDSFLAEDIEGDGDLDLFLSSPESALVVTVSSGAVVSTATFPFTGSGGTGTPTATPTPTGSPVATPGNVLVSRVAATAPGCSDGTIGMVVVEPSIRRAGLICRNPGDGNWLVGAPLPILGTLPSDAAVADFDGDSDLDVAVALPATTPGPPSGGFQAFTRTAAGFTPGAAVVAAPGTFVEAIAAGDFTGDGDPDLVLGGYTPSRLVLLPGAGGSAFAAAIPIPGGDVGDGYPPGSLEVVDIDADGNLDLLTRPIGGGTVQFHVHYGTGTGLGPPVRVSTVPNSAGPIGRALDLEGDGGPRTLVSRVHQGTTATTYLQAFDTDGARNAGPVLVSPETQVSSLSRGTDYLYASRRFDSGSAIDGGVARMVIGAPSPTDVASLDSSADAASVHAGKLDGDEFDDLLIADDGANDGLGGIWLVPGLTATSFGTPIPIVVSAPIGDAAAGDLDGDGLLDFAGAAISGSDELVLWFGTGGGASVSAPSFVPNISPMRLAIADLGGDAQLDLVSTDALSASVFTWTFDGRTPVLEDALPLGGVVPTDFVLADFDGDTLLDLAVRSRFAISLVNIDVFRGTLDGLDPVASQRIRLDEATTGAQGMSAADVDGDGLLDLVVPIGTPSSFAVMRGRTDGTLSSEPELIPYPGIFNTLGVFDGDGVAPDDFLVCQPGSGPGVCFGYQNQSR